MLRAPANSIKSLDIRRFDEIDLDVPPQVPLILHITQLESYGEPDPLPNLAIDPDNAIEEIIEWNNTAVAQDYRNVGYFTW